MKSNMTLAWERVSKFCIGGPVFTNLLRRAGEVANALSTK